MKKISLVTTTFSRCPEDLRFQMALKTCRAAREAGYPLYIVDGSPDPQMKDLLLDAGATVVSSEEEKGMGASRRQCFRMGLNYTTNNIIVWLEPEKYPFVPLIGPCADMIGEGKYDIIVPGRRSLQSYPRYQELSELRLNRNIGIMTGRSDLDWTFGPRVMSRRGVESVVDYKGQFGPDNWETLHTSLVWASARGIRVGSKLVDYVHPSEQTTAEEGDPAMDAKRDLQRTIIEESIMKVCLCCGVSGLP